MYARTYIQTLREIEHCVQVTLDTMSSLESSKAAENIDIILETLTDYSIMYSEMNYRLPSRAPEDSDLIEQCLNKMRMVGPLRLDKHSLPGHRRLTESDHIEVVKNYVLIPLGSSGTSAFAWVPMLDISIDIFNSISDDLSRLAMRARTDCSDFYANVWTATHHAIELLSSYISIKKLTGTEKIELKNTKSIIQQ